MTLSPTELSLSQGADLAREKGSRGALFPSNTDIALILRDL